jgi:hypothetical protein
MVTWPEYDAVARRLAVEEGGGGFQVSGVGGSGDTSGAHLNHGSPTLQNLLAEATGARPGSGRAKRLLDLGREGYEWLNQAGWTLSSEEA